MRKNLFIFSPHLRHTATRVLFCVGFAAAVFGAPVAALAQTAQSAEQAAITAQAAGITGESDLITIIGRIINVFLGLLGIVFLVLLLYAGYLWMTSAGDPEKVKKAQDIIRNAIIGLVIIASAWAITSFILSFFAGGGGVGGGIIPRQPPPPLQGAPPRTGALGNIIESVLPEPNATGVPRNTPVMVTFKEPIYPGSFIKDWTDATSNTVNGLNDNVVKIFRTDTGPSGALSSDKARVWYTDDLKTFVIRPVEWLGSPTVNVGYTVDLMGGAQGVQKNELKGGAHPAAFTGVFGSGYTWPFEVSTVADLTPPVVTAVVPQELGEYDRNIVIQIHFNKPMDPTSVSGKTPLFTNIEVLSGAPPAAPSTPVAGEYRVSNHYYTIEFVTDSLCGTNSCGRDVYCLPGNAAIQVTAKAATVDPSAKPQAVLTSNGYNGVVSAVGNSLDGNKNGTADGPVADDYLWGFGTTNNIRLEPPKIESTIPDSDPQTGGNSNVPLDQPVTAKFDTLLQPSTLNSDSIKLYAHGRDEKPDTFWFTVGMRLLNFDGSVYDPYAVPQTTPMKAAAVIDHRVYMPSGDGLQNLNLYDPYLLSDIQDAYQNCFNPAAKCGTGTGDPNCCNSFPTSDACKNILKTP